MENIEANRNYTDEERIALAAKLDADLDIFINSLEKKRYTEGWAPDKWEEVRIIKYCESWFTCDSDLL
jgi:hypothetical protein